MKKMNRLALNRGYLCGAMDRVTDGGVGWRQDLKASLKELKILWLDPTRKPIDIGVEDLENRALRQKAKRAGDFEFIRTQMKQIRPVDLRMWTLPISSWSTWTWMSTPAAHTRNCTGATG